jgi:hypothetical protein
MRSSPRQIILEALAATLPDLDPRKLEQAADEIALRLSQRLREEDRPNLRGAIVRVVLDGDNQPFREFYAPVLVPIP